MKEATNRKWFMVITAAGATLVTTAVVAGGAYAYQGSQGNGERGPRFDSAKHEAIKSAMENNDYDAWKEAVDKDGKIDEKITQDNFSKLVEAYNLSKDGKHQEAKEIADELGIKKPFKKGPGKFGHRPGPDPEKREAVNKALENGDYNAWKSAAGEDNPVTKEVTEDEFPRLIEAHDLLQEGEQKFKESRQIMEELGVKKGPGQGQDRR